ncbi:MAG TPA: hypothetical protein VL995_05395 [Cellvibrio sp.]|nr:hypothetical protein [Cellvibrio sp.]
MWIRKAPYPVKPDLPSITRHDQLPTGCKQLASISDNTSDRHLYFVNNHGFLSILDMVDRQRKDGSWLYHCAQDDFPLELLIWLPIALEEFQKPPAEGGLHAGGIATPDMNVGGEMLSLVRALGSDQGRGGYGVDNYSRCVRDKNIETSFTPHSVSWASRFLYEGGLLNLIIELGEKLKVGKL